MSNIFESANFVSQYDHCSGPLINKKDNNCDSLWEKGALHLKIEIEI